MAPSTILKTPSEADPGAGRQALRRLAELLALPRVPRQERDLAEIVAKRIVPDAIDRLARGSSSRHLDFIIPPRTLSQSQGQGRATTLDESDRAMRVDRRPRVALADAVFGDDTRALVGSSAPADSSGEERLRADVSEASRPQSSKSAAATSTKVISPDTPWPPDSIAS